MSLINTNIPKQGFETVRDLIGAVLKVELENQKTLKGLTDNFGVFVGRSTPFAQSEIIMINVLLDSANYTQKTAKNNMGATSYFVDIYVTAKEKSNVDGGYAATVKRDFYLGLCQFILSDHHYNTLGTPLGLIMGTVVEGFECYEPQNQQDASFVKMARINFSVRINEESSLWEGLDINSIFTNVNLDLTDEGYVFSDIN